MNTPHKILGALVLGTTLMGCGARRATPAPQSQTQINNVLLESYRLIDHQRYDEAVQILESQISESPQSLDLHMAAASAYASKAGVKPVEFLRVAMTAASFIVKGKAKAEQTVAANIGTADVKTADVKEDKSENGQKLLQAAASFSKGSALAMEIFEELPVVSRDGEVLLREAIKQIGSLETQLRISDIRYRIVLRAIYLKSHLLHFNDKALPASQEVPYCLDEVVTLKKEIITVGKNLSLLFADLAASSHPDQVSQWKSASEDTAKVADLTAEVTADLAGLALILETFKDFAPFAKLQSKIGICQ